MRTRSFITAAAAALLIVPAAGAKAADRNHDGIPDSWERRHRLALVSGQDVKDQDKDGLTNLVEWQARTHPRKRDTDRDGTPDAREDGDRDGLRNGFEGPTGHDARKPDSDKDGVKDGREGAGRVLRVAGPAVTIDLGAGRRSTATLRDPSGARCGALDEWLLGLFDDPAAAITDLVDSLLPGARSLRGLEEEDEMSEDTTPDDATGEPPEWDPQDMPGSSPAEPADATADQDDAEEAEDADLDGACPAGAVRKGTWVRGSAVQAGTFTRLDLVLRG